MKRVTLIGDSIRMGYQDYVQSELADVAEIWGPVENGGDSRNVLAHLEEWIGRREADLVHVNAGLHDIKTPFDSTERQVCEAEYETNIRKILSRAMDATSGRVVWAMTTPVNYERHHETKGFDRFEEDVVARNTIAKRVCIELGVQVNDLYGLVMRHGRDRMLVADGVHYAPEAYAALGHAVAGTIRGLL